MLAKRKRLCNKDWVSRVGTYVCCVFLSMCSFFGAYSGVCEFVYKQKRKATMNVCENELEERKGEI